MAYRIKEVEKNEIYVYDDVYYDLIDLFDLIKIFQKVDLMKDPPRDVIYIIFDDSDGHTCFTSR